jgi:DNA-binding Xre family transcriptional regulator
MKQLRINTDVFQSHPKPMSELARKTGLSINTVKSIAQGKQRRVEFEVLEKLAQTLELNPMDLLKEADDDTDE